MEALAIDPILVDTGQHEPIFDKPRQYADVQNEIATRLANLPKFTAQVKIVGADGNSVEHTIQTSAPEQGLGKGALKDRIERIRTQNMREGFIRLRQEVEEEIRVRHEQCSELQQVPPGVPRRKKIT